MLKFLILAAAIAFVHSQDQGSGAGNSAGACADKDGWKGTQPQNLGKGCAEQSPDNCKFIDESIRECCATCQVRKDEKGAPTQAPSNDKPGKIGKKGKACFHGDDTVQTKEHGVISMHQLAQHRDAHVLTRNDDGQLEYSAVRYWLHSQPTMKVKFLTLQTESGHRLSITGDHLIYETDCQGGAGQAIYAKKVQVGRCLWVNQNGQLKETKVVEKGEEKMTGIYSPITTTGSIVVNDVLASCYNYYENESLQKYVYGLVISCQDALANWMPSTLYQAAFNNQNGALVAVPRLILNFLQLSNVFVH